MNELSTIVVTLATVLTSAGAWQYWQKRMKIKHDERNTDRSEQTMFRDDLRERVGDKAKTERKLTEVLTQLAEYKVRLEFLEKENERLKAR